MTLAAVTNDRDLAPLDHGQVCIVVVEHFSHGGLLQVVDQGVGEIR
jgi:hypothetical protein